jgi:hypothetical protein
LRIKMVHLEGHALLAELRTRIRGGRVALLGKVVCQIVSVGFDRTKQ